MVPKRIREWWSYLRSLNEYQEHGKILMLEGNVSVGVPLEVRRKISSGDDYFAYGIMGFTEWVPVGGPPAVMDLGLTLKDRLTLQVDLDIPEVSLFDAPINFGQICGPDMSTMEPIEFGHVLRLVHDSTVKATWTPRAGFSQTPRRVGIAFVGCWASQNALSYAFKKGYEREVRASQRHRRDQRASGSPMTLEEVE